MSWKALEELDVRERALVAAERWDDLLALQAERQDVIDALPVPLPRESRPVLEAALRGSRATQAALRDGLARTEAQLAALRRGRRTLSAYDRTSRAGLETRA